MKPLTYVAVDKLALGHNLRQVRGLLDPGTALLAVVKANGYGHGLELAGAAFAEAGADWLGVSTLEEGRAVRRAGLTLPALVFLPCPEAQFPELIAADLTATVTGEAALVALARAAEAAGRPARFQFFLDGGLGRPGVGRALPRLLELATGFAGLELTGIYLHMDNGADFSFSELEALRPGGDFRLLAAAVRDLSGRLLGEPTPLSVAASGLTLLQPAARLDLVRVGTLLYGQYPGYIPSAQRTLELRSALELRSTIVAVETLTAGATVGYGAEYTCRRETRVGLLPVGLASGLGVVPASLAARRYGGVRAWLRRRVRGAEGHAAWVAGQPTRLLGRIAMDWCCVDLTDLPETGPGDEVVLECRRTLLSPALPRLEVDLGAAGSA
ncbi:MAG TPA: alanine racemase [Armatimonadota bacterium]